MTLLLCFIMFMRHLFSFLTCRGNLLAKTSFQSASEPYMYPYCSQYLSSPLHFPLQYLSIWFSVQYFTQYYAVQFKALLFNNSACHKIKTDIRPFCSSFGEPASIWKKKIYLLTADALNRKGKWTTRFPGPKAKCSQICQTFKMSNEPWRRWQVLLTLVSIETHTCTCAAELLQVIIWQGKHLLSCKQRAVAQ